MRRANAGIEKMADELERLNKKGLPIASKETLNETAKRTRVFAQSEIQDEFTTRNSFTVRSIVYNRAQGMDVKKMVSSVGSVQPYMAGQYSGFTVRSQGKHGVPVPMGSAAGQHGQQTRTKTVRKQFYLNKIELDSWPKAKFKNARQRRLVAVRQMLKQKRRVIFGTFNNQQGYWQLVGGRLGKKGRGWPTGLRMRLLYATDYRSIKTPPSRWLDRPTSRGANIMPSVYLSRIKGQIEWAKRNLK